MESTGHLLFVSTHREHGHRLLIDVTYTLERDGEDWVATCPEIGASSFGDTPDEAHEALTEAVGLLLNEAQDGGYLPSYLRDRNVRVRALPAEQASEAWSALEPALPL